MTMDTFLLLFFALLVYFSLPFFRFKKGIWDRNREAVALAQKSNAGTLSEIEQGKLAYYHEIGVIDFQPVIDPKSNRWMFLARLSPSAMRELWS